MKRFLFVVIILASFLISANVQAQYQRLNTEVFRNGILFHFPETDYVFFDDFTSFDSTITSNKQYVITRTARGSSNSSDSSRTYVMDAVGGILLVASHDTLGSGLNLQTTYETFALDTVTTTTDPWNPLEFKARHKIDLPDSAHLFLGMSARDIAIYDAASDFIGFLVKAGNDTLFVVNARNNAGDTTQTTIELQDSTFYTFGFEYNGKNVIGFTVDGAGVATHTTVSLMPADEELAPSYNFETGFITTANRGYLDWWFGRFNRR